MRNTGLPLLSLLVSCLVAAGCSGLTPVEPVRARPVDLPERACFSLADRDPVDCQVALVGAAQDRDRQLAGQALLGAAHEAPPEAQSDVARAAFWLNPNAWLNEGQWELTIAVTDLAVPDPLVPADAALLFEGAEAPSSVANPHAVALRIPASESALTGDSLAGSLAAATGARVAAWRAGEGSPVRVVPAAPLFSRLLGFQPAGLEGGWRVAELVSQADRALQGARWTESYLRLGEAIEALPEDAPPCRLHGALLHLRWQVGTMASAGDLADLTDSLREVCTEAALTGPEAEAGEYLAALGFLLRNRRSASSQMSIAVEWLRDADFRAYQDRVGALADRLPDRRGALLRALLTDVEGRRSWSLTDVCDAEAEAVRETRLAEAAAAFRALDRRDLTLDPANPVEILFTDRPEVSLDLFHPQVVDRAALADFLAWMDEDHDAWLRVDALNAFLVGAGRLGLVATDPGPVAEVCGRYLEAVRSEVERDRFDDFNGRNVGRLFKAFSVAGTCPDREPVLALVDAAMAASVESGEGHAGLLSLLGGTAVQSLVAAFTGQTQSIQLALTTLAESLVRVREGLGDSPEDRALDTSIGVILGLGSLLGPGDTRQLEAALESAADVFAAVSEEATPESPVLVRLAPSLRLASLTLLGALQVFGGDEAAGQRTLEQLDAALEPGLAAFLANFEAPDLSGQMVGIVRAGRELLLVVGEPDATSLAAVLPRLESILEPDPEEEGWWALGLDAARLILWDVFFAIALDVGDEALAERASVASNQLAERMVGPTLDYFDVRGTAWEMLNLFPILHRILLTSVAGDRPVVEVAREMEVDLDAAIRDAVDRMQAAIPDSGEEADLIQLVVDAFDVAADIGVERLIAPDMSGLALLGQGLAERSERYTREQRVAIELLIGALGWRDDPVAAEAAFRRAEEAAEDSLLDDQGYLPGLIEAALLARDDRVGEALERVDAALDYAGPAQVCGELHGVEGLLPTRMWLLQRLGRPDDVDATYRSFAQMMGAGFGGDGQINCSAVSQRGKVYANATVGNLIGNLVVSTSSEGTFNVGLGFQSTEGEVDRFTCSDGPVSQKRPDRILLGHLVRAAYALQAGDDEVAHAALLRAVDEARLLVYAGPPLFTPEELAGINLAREHLYRPLVEWVATAARARGHLLTSGQLFDFLSAMEVFDPSLAEAEAAAEDGATAEAGEEDEAPRLPAYLIGLAEWEPLRGSVDAWRAFRDDNDVDALARALRADRDAVTFVPSWSVDLQTALAHLYAEQPGRAREVLARAPTPDTPAGEAAMALLDQWVAVLSGEPVDEATVGETLAELAAAGLYGDLGEFAISMADQVRRQGDRFGAARILNQAVQLVRVDVAPGVLSDLFAAMLPLLLELGDPAEIFPAVEHVVEFGYGRYRPQVNLEHQTTLINLAAWLGRFDQAAEAADALTPALVRALGADHPNVFRLRCMRLAAGAAGDGVLDSYEESLLAALIDLVERGAPAEPEELDFIGMLRDSVGDPEAVQTVAQDYLSWLMGR